MSEFDAINGYENTIDSRDIIARIEYLGGRLDDPETAEIWGPLDESEKRELKDLQLLAQDGEKATSDWAHGVTLINDSYFEDYAREFASDIGAISDDDKWPANHIDWPEAAKELQQDYSSVEYDDHTFWLR